MHFQFSKIVCSKNSIELHIIQGVPKKSWTRAGITSEPKKSKYAENDLDR
jgi:hypothetical protein